MAKKLYVGNLPYSVSDSDLQRLFEPHGAVQSAQVVVDRDTGRSKGFGFVEMETGEGAQAAISALNGQDFSGRSLTVNEARPREERGGGGGRGGYGGGGRRGGGGGYGGGRRYSVRVAVRDHCVNNLTPFSCSLAGEGRFLFSAAGKRWIVL